MDEAPTEVAVFQEHLIKVLDKVGARHGPQASDVALIQEKETLLALIFDDGPVAAAQALAALIAVLSDRETRVWSIHGLVWLANALTSRLNSVSRYEPAQKELAEVHFWLVRAYAAVLDRLLCSLHLLGHEHDDDIEPEAPLSPTEFAAMLSENLTAIQGSTNRSHAGVVFAVHMVEEATKCFEMIREDKASPEIIHALDLAARPTPMAELSDFLSGSSAPSQKSEWWLAALLLSRMAAYAKESLEDCRTFQSFLFQQSQKASSWKWLFAATDLLASVALEGFRLEIRLSPLQGGSNTVDLLDLLLTSKNSQVRFGVEMAIRRLAVWRSSTSSTRSLEAKLEVARANYKQQASLYSTKGKQFEDQIRSLQAELAAARQTTPSSDPRQAFPNTPSTGSTGGEKVDARRLEEADREIRELRSQLARAKSDISDLWEQLERNGRASCNTSDDGESSPLSPTDLKCDLGDAEKGTLVVITQTPRKRSVLVVPAMSAEEKFMQETWAELAAIQAETQRQFEATQQVLAERSALLTPRSQSAMDDLARTRMETQHEYEEVRRAVETPQHERLRITADAVRDHLQLSGGPSASKSRGGRSAKKKSLLLPAPASETEIRRGARPVLERSLPTSDSHLLSPRGRAAATEAAAKRPALTGGGGHGSEATLMESPREMARGLGASASENGESAVLRRKAPPIPPRTPQAEAAGRSVDQFYDDQRWHGPLTPPGELAGDDSADFERSLPAESGARGRESGVVAKRNVGESESGLIRGGSPSRGRDSPVPRLALGRLNSGEVREAEEKAREAALRDREARESRERESALRDDVAALHKKLVSTEQELRGVRSALDDTEHRASGLASECRAARDREARLQEDLAETQERLTRLTEVSSAAGDESIRAAADLRRQLREATSAKEQLERKQSELSAAHGRLQTDHAQRDEITRAEHARRESDLSDKLARLQAELGKKDEEVGRLERRCKELEQQRLAMAAAKRTLADAAAPPGSPAKDPDYHALYSGLLSNYDELLASYERLRSQFDEMASRGDAELTVLRRRLTESGSTSASEAATMRTLLNAARRERDELDQELLEVRAEHERDVSALRVLLRERERELASASAELEEFRTEWKSERASMRDMLDSRQLQLNKLQGLAQDYNTLDRDHATLDKTLRTMQRQHQALVEQAAAEKLALGAERDGLVRRVAYLQKLAGPREEADQHFDALLRDFETLRREHGALTQRYEDLQRAHASLQSARERTDAVHTERIARLEEEQHVATAQRAAYDDLASKHGELQRRLAALQREHEATQDALDDAMPASRANSLQVDLGATTAELQKLRVAHASTLDELDAMRDELQALQSHNDDRLEEREMLMTTKEELKRSRRDHERELTALRERLKNTEKMVASRDQAELYRRYSLLEERHAALEDEYESLQRKLQSRPESGAGAPERDHLLDLLNASKRECAELRARVARLEDENEELAARP